MGLTSRSRASSARRPRSFRPWLQILEDRDLLSVFVVDRLTDTGEGAKLAGDFRYCLTQAVDGDTITFGVEGTINLTRALPDLTHSIAIEGPGADRLTVRRGMNYYRIFTTMSADVTISGLTVTGGTGSLGGGIFVDGGNVNLTDSVVTGNAGGGVYVQSGSLALTNSVVTGNGSFSGGGVYVQSGSLTVANTLITNNTAGTSAARAIRASSTMLSTSGPLNTRATIPGPGSRGPVDAMTAPWPRSWRACHWP